MHATKMIPTQRFGLSIFVVFFPFTTRKAKVCPLDILHLLEAIEAALWRDQHGPYNLTDRNVDSCPVVY